MLRIRNQKLCSILQEKRVMSLDVALLMAGAKERGELEARVTSLINEVQEAGDAYLYIHIGFEVLISLLKVF